MYTHTRRCPHNTWVLRVTQHLSQWHIIPCVWDVPPTSYYYCKLGKQITDLPNKHQSAALLLCTPWLPRYHNQKPPWSSSTPTPHFCFPAPPLTPSCNRTTCLSSYPPLPYFTCLTRLRFQPIPTITIKFQPIPYNNNMKLILLFKTITSTSVKHSAFTCLLVLKYSL